MLKRTNYLSHSYDKPDGYTLAAYEQSGGYTSAKKALSTMAPKDVVSEMKAAHIRGRGGAGFDCGTKWSFMPPPGGKPHYLVVNADEGEPGTFKDRTIMERNPHSLIEGCIIAGFAMGAHAAYIYVRDELHLSKARLWSAIEEARAKGYLGKTAMGTSYAMDVFVHTGAGAYICGEETALLNSLEGRRGEPRLKPPFPAQVGAFGCPSTVNNVETIAIAPTVLSVGGDAFSQLSALHEWNDGGARLFGVSGHVKNPGVYECAVGLTLRELIYDLGGGISGDASLLAVIPGGSSCPVHLADEVVNVPGDPRFEPYNGKSFLDLPMGVDTFRGVGSMLGTCCAIVMSDKTDPVLALHNVMRFYRHESCGQCTPCREGCGWIERILDKVVGGRAQSTDRDRFQHYRQHHLRLRRRSGAAGAELRAEVPGTARGLREDRGQRTDGDARIMTAGSLLFVVCSALCLAGALIVVLARNPIRGALGLLTTIVGIAGLFLRLNAQFLAAMQLLVYAGAVVILFVFVIMLIGANSQTDDGGAKVTVSRVLGGAIISVLGVVSLGLIGFGDHHPFQVITPAHGSIEAVGGRLFREGLVPFELATVLLIVAVVGAIAVARTQPGAKKTDKPGSEEEHETKRLFSGPVVAKDAPWPGDATDESSGTAKESA
jgi:NADH-quinone oxidoreductase subunit F